MLEYDTKSVQYGDPTGSKISYETSSASSARSLVRTLRHCLLGHPLIGRVWVSTDLVGCVLVSSGSRSRCALTGILEPQGTVSPGFNPPWRGLVYSLVPLFRRMPTGPEAFLDPPGTSRLRPCAQTHLKKGFVSRSYGLWDVWQIELSFFGIPILEYLKRRAINPALAYFRQWVKCCLGGGDFFSFRRCFILIA